ncbi:MAG: GNAT family N-acetyltransferase [Gemmatimonadetes bacterium]|nr:GNAT family N-acetyltransferase [Gemmatimonadota bacterium]
MSDAATGPDQGVVVVEIMDERTPLADRAVGLFEATFDRRDRHAVDELRAEIAEKRYGLLAPFNFHLLAARAGDDLIGAIMGCYLAGVNAGFVDYLAVRPGDRGRGVGRILRPRLVDQFREDAREAGRDELAWVLGEVRLENPWLRRLVETRGAIPFDLAYFHPGMRPGVHSPPYVLYRQPFGDLRKELPNALVRRILYAVYRRAYRVRYPLQHEGFMAMIEALEGRESVGIHPDFG